MRITKKFAGASCIGKQVFQPNEDFIEYEVVECEEELRSLEERFLARLLGKEAKNASGGAAASVQGRSSGRDRSRNSSNSMNHSDDYYMDDAFGGDLDDEVGSSSRGAKAILSGTSEWLLTSKKASEGRPIHRVMSAPSLSDPFKYSQSAFRALNTVHAKDRSGGRGSGLFATGGRSGRQDPSPPNQHSRGARCGSLKRTMSVITLDEHDPFYGDDKAASDLLMEFVTKVTQDSQKPASPAADFVAEEQRARKLIKSESSGSEVEDGRARTLSPFGSSSPKDNSAANGGNSSDNSSSGITTIEAAMIDDEGHLIHSEKNKGDETDEDILQGVSPPSDGGGHAFMAMQEESRDKSSPVGLDMVI